MPPAAAATSTTTTESILTNKKSEITDKMCLTTPTTKTSSSSTTDENCIHQRNISLSSSELINNNDDKNHSIETKSTTINPTVIKNNNENNVLKRDNENDDEYKEFIPQIRWPDLLVQIFIHAGFVYGLYLLFSVKIQTLIWFFVLIVGTGFGITAGAHRLWSHKSYRANLPLRLILIFLFTIAGQRDAYTWALDHRIHHKYSETDADPHNAKRGFFFAHVAWLFLTPHPKVVEKRKVIDMSDLESDRVVMWQKTLYVPLFALLAIAFPVFVPWYFWDEDLWRSFWVNFNCRFCVTLNIAFFVNSVAHMWGRRPYDKNISPVENLTVAIAALGEGWHNYHHVFPWDYKTGEFGDYKFNITTAFIDTFAKFGWAYDRKAVSPSMIARRAAKCGDGTYFLNDEIAHKDQVWGYGDKDIPKEDEAELEAMRD